MSEELGCTTCDGTGCDICNCQECGEEFTDPCERHIAGGHVPSFDPYGDGVECEGCCPDCVGGIRLPLVKS